MWQMWKMITYWWDTIIREWYLLPLGEHLGNILASNFTLQVLVTQRCTSKEWQIMMGHYHIWKISAALGWGFKISISICLYSVSSLLSLGGKLKILNIGLYTPWVILLILNVFEFGLLWNGAVCCYFWTPKRFKVGHFSNIWLVQIIWTNEYVSKMWYHMMCGFATTIQSHDDFNRIA